MKRSIKIITGLIISAVAFMSCNKDDTARTAIALTGLHAEALPGSIELGWDYIQDPDFLYVEVAYFDYATEQLKSTLCSRYTNSLKVDGLLNRYGEYDFVFTVYDKNGAVGQPVHLLRQCQKAEPYYITDSELKLPLDKSQLGTNAQEPSEGPIENLVDDDLDTFFQSFWDEYNFPELKPNGYHYITVDLKTNVKSIIIKYWNRKKGGSLPQTINIYKGTEDGKWTLLTTLTNLPADPGSSYTSDLLLSEDEFSRIKIEVVKGTDTYQPFFSIAELQVINVVRKLIDPEVE